MIVSKLSLILEERFLKISDIARETGVTRPTLTSLCNGSSKGINFDTLDKLCRFLSVTPNELLAYYDFEFDNVSINTVNSDIFKSSLNPFVFGDFPMLLGFYGKLPVKENQLEPIKFIGYFTNKSNEFRHHLEVKIIIYSQPDEMRFLASTVAKPLISKSIEDIVDTNFNDIYSLRFFVRYKDLDKFEYDFSTDNISHK